MTKLLLSLVRNSAGILRALVSVSGFALIALILVHTTTEKFNQLRAKNEMFETQQVTLAERERQLDCLAKNVYYEAGGEPFEGKVAVAQVTINRANSGQFPSDICKVVYQKNVIYDRVICQFSWYCENAGVNRTIRPAHLQESYAVAKKVLLEGFRLDSIKGVLYFHADHVPPRGREERVTQIGHHIFYRK
jgi:spore germination cell wall hydrolase CwlJ-like protein